MTRMVYSMVDIHVLISCIDWEFEVLSGIYYIYVIIDIYIYTIYTCKQLQSRVELLSYQMTGWDIIDGHPGQLSKYS